MFPLFFLPRPGWLPCFLPALEGRSRVSWSRVLPTSPSHGQASNERKKKKRAFSYKKDGKTINRSAIDRVLGCCNPNQLVFSTGAKNYSDEKF